MVTSATPGKRAQGSTRRDHRIIRSIAYTHSPMCTHRIMPSRLGFLKVAAHHHDISPTTCQPFHCLQANARSCARDHTGLAGHGGIAGLLHRVSVLEEDQFIP